MRIFSVTVILAAIVFAAVRVNDPDTAFWNMLYGFAVMLAIFNVLNLKIHWAAGFGAVAYGAIGYKMISAVLATGQTSSGTLQISGIIIASIYCLSLALAGAIKNRHSNEGVPETSS